MKAYIGYRKQDERGIYKCEVLVVETTDTGHRHYHLPQYQEIRNHSPAGFAWGYGGSGPAQLALAILADYFGPSPDESVDQWRKVEDNYQRFKEDIIAKLPEESFVITSQEIDLWVAWPGPFRGA